MAITNHDRIGKALDVLRSVTLAEKRLLVWRPTQGETDLL